MAWFQAISENKVLNEGVNPVRKSSTFYEEAHTGH
jgi:hypothetical protein